MSAIPATGPSRAATAEWLAAGFLLTFSSAPGQTFFIGLFSGPIRTELDIGNGAFGASYMVATLVSSALLMTFGRVTDRDRLVFLSLATLAGLAAVSLAMAGLAGGWMLPLVFVGLRLFGQGFLGHIAMTAMGRWFDRNRGKAVALAATGFPASQAVFPAAAILLMEAVGWRLTWVATAAFLILVAMPATAVLLRREPGAATAPIRLDGAPAAPTLPERRHWTRAEVLRDPTFYLVMPGVLVPPFVVTGIFFEQSAIVDAKGWTLSWFVGWYGAHAAATIVASFAMGWAVDRFGSLKMLSFFLLPLAVGCGLVAWMQAPVAVPVFMVLSGLSSGSSGTLHGALWAELYGTRNLGAIRSLSTACLVFASALAPGLMGILLDMDVGIESQLVGLTVYTAATTVLMMAVTPALLRRAALLARPEGSSPPSS